MGTRGPSALRRTVLRWSDMLSARPTAALVFALSIAGVLVLAYLQGVRPLPLQAIVHAEPVEIRSPLLSQVLERHVGVGDAVETGQMLLTLDRTGTQRDLDLVEREIEALRTERVLGAATLLGDGQIDAFGTLRSRLQVEQMLRVSRARTGALKQLVSAATAWRDNVANLVQQGVEPRSALIEAERALAEARAEEREAQTVAATSQDQSSALGEAATNPVGDVIEKHEAATAAALDLLSSRRDQLRADLDRATVRATAPGRVAHLAPMGARSGDAQALARIVPAQSRTLIAYLPATADQAAAPIPGQRVALGAACPEGGEVLRTGPVVVPAPEQVQGPRPGTPMFGLPVYIQLPVGCSMTPGFVLLVDLLPL